MIFLAIVGTHLVKGSVGANGQVVFTSTTNRGYIASSLTAPLGGKMPFGMGSVLGMPDVSLPAG